MPGSPPLTGAYSIEIRDRSGQPSPSCLFNEGVIQAGYGRAQDDTSTAFLNVTAPAVNSACAECMPRAWEDLLVFYRDDQIEPVWRGPIVEWAYSADELRITAADGMAELGDRRATANHPALAAGDVPTVDPLDLMAWIMDQANAVQPLPLFVMTPVRPSATSLVTAQIAEGDLLQDALLDVSLDWIDWTVAGPRLYYGSPTLLLPGLPTLDTETSWFVPPQVVRDGVSMADEVEVIGAAGVYAKYPPVRQPGAVYLPMRVVREGLTSQTQADQLAADVWADNQTPQVLVVTNGTLSPACPIAVEDLIPGRLVTVSHVQGRRHELFVQRLSSMFVEIASVNDGGGWALVETSVEIELQPAKVRVGRTEL